MDAISKMKAHGVELSDVAWDVVFMRKVGDAQEAGEWDQWLSIMDDGLDKITTSRMVDLRATSLTKSVMRILETAPNTQEQACESWQAIRSLLPKVFAAAWHGSLPDHLKSDLNGVQSLVVVGCKMHHSEEQELQAAETFKSEVAKSKHFPRLLTASTSGNRLALAICDVATAYKAVGGWKEDLEQAMKSLAAIGDLPQPEQILHDDFELKFSQSGKLLDMSSKLASLLQNSTDKFQSDYKADFQKLKDQQVLWGGVMKKALLLRVFKKTGGLLEKAMTFVSTAHETKPGDGDDAFLKTCEQHSDLFISSKKISTTFKLNLSKMIGPDVGSSLNEALAACSTFLESLAGVCKWHQDLRASLALVKC